MGWTDRFLKWLSRTGSPRDVALANTLGVSVITIHNWKHGAIPHPDRCKRIERLSGGYVKASLAVRTRTKRAA